MAKTHLKQAVRSETELNCMICSSLILEVILWTFSVILSMMGKSNRMNGEVVKSVKWNRDFYSWHGASAG